jgi:FG-GAP-like repeat
VIGFESEQVSPDLAKKRGGTLGKVPGPANVLRGASNSTGGRKTMRDQKRFLMSVSSMRSFTRFLALGLVAFLSALAGPPRATAQGIVPLPIAVSGTWSAFGPESFVRTSGGSIATPRTFSVLNPNTSYTLRINNGGAKGEFARATGFVFLNGVQIAGPNDLNREVSLIQKKVNLQIYNRLIIKLLSPAGTGIALEIVGVDDDVPSISGVINPPPNAAGWNDSNVTVSFKCSDKTSGVAICPSPVAITTEGANQVVHGIAIDKAGNRATASITVNLDKTPPTISGTLNPPADASGWNSGNVTVNFTCSDSLSRVAMCPAPVAVTAEGANQVVTGTATDGAGNTATANVTVNISFNFFSVRNYGGKCLDYGAATRARSTTVFLNDCAAAHPIRVQEINDRHEVILHAGTSVIGIHNPPVATLGGPPPPPQTEFPLELQRYNPILATTANQIFSLDGDSIILASTRPCINTDGGAACDTPPPHLVIQVQNARGANGSPLVVGLRNLADSEFWDFNAIDGSDKDPTSGFVRLGFPEDPTTTFYRLLYLIAPYGSLTPSQAGPGTVIKIAQGTTIDLTAQNPLQIPSGVTIRGDRRGTLFGPLLCNGCSSGFPDAPGNQGAMLEIAGYEVRITGLRLQGTSRKTDGGQPGSTGVFGHEKYFHSIVDHNDISDWTAAGVMVLADPPEQAPPVFSCQNGDPRIRLHSNLIARNFIHHNRMQDNGYGVDPEQGGYALVEGNTFVSNRHAIASWGSPHSGYRAWFNLVLADAPVQETAEVPYYVHDFDMHGTGDRGFGGGGGDYVDIFRNTFLGTNRKNYVLRGIPCNNTDFHQNVSLESRDDALNYKDHLFQVFDQIKYMNVADNPNQFQLPNPTTNLGPASFGVGDFDHDGDDDLFLATGAAWYYSPAGAREWRFLSAKSDTIDQLLLGDFDGDGRTDVVTLSGGQFWVSWGGVSDWEVLNPDPTGGNLLLLPSAITAMAVGDFDGDGRVDIFWADGKTWWVSFGGSTPFVRVADSSFHLKDLRFGDFDGNGTTDVFGVVSDGVSNYWMVSYSPKSMPGTPFSTWQKLRPALTNTVDGLFVADFNGDGTADVAMDCGAGAPGCWSISYGGFQDWQYPNIGPTGPYVAGVGHFLGRIEADLLLWNDPQLGISVGGIYPPIRYSSQDMH